MTQSPSDSSKTTAKPIQILEAPLRTTLWIALGISCLGVIWSATAQIPIQVNGVGVIIPPGGLSNLTSRTTGNILYQIKGNSTVESPQNAEIRQFWKTGIKDIDDLNRQKDQSIDRTSELRVLDLARSITLPPSSQRSFARSVNNDKEINIMYENGTVLAIIDSPSDREVLSSKLRSTLLNINLRQSSEKKIRTLLQNFIKTYQNQTSQQQVIGGEVEQQIDWGKTLSKLAKIGWIPRSLYLQASSQVLGLRSNLISTNGQLISTLQSIQDSQQKLLQLDSDIRMDLNSLKVAMYDYLKKTYVFAPTNMYIVSTSFRNGQNVVDGSTLFTYTTSPPKLPTIITTYFSAKQASQIFPGMQALVTPTGISRAQYGGIFSKVLAVETSPSSREEITAQTGISEIGEMVDATESVPFRVELQLQKTKHNTNYACRNETAEECYNWNSGAEPPFPTRLGNTVNIQVTTRYQTPLQMVIPLIRKFLGLATDA
jgi:multidrug resistance efflux pump